MLGGPSVDFAGGGSSGGGGVTSSLFVTLPSGSHHTLTTTGGWIPVWLTTSTHHTQHGSAVTITPGTTEKVLFHLSGLYAISFAPVVQATTTVTSAIAWTVGSTWSGILTRHPPFPGMHTSLGGSTNRRAGWWRTSITGRKLTQIFLTTTVGYVALTTSATPASFVFGMNLEVHTLSAGVKVKGYSASLSIAQLSLPLT